MIWKKTEMQYKGVLINSNKKFKRNIPIINSYNEHAVPSRSKQFDRLCL